MSLFGHNSFGSFIAYHSEDDWTTAAAAGSGDPSGHGALTEASMITEQALGEQFALWTNMEEVDQTDSRLAVYKQGGADNWVWDLVTVKGDDNTLVKYHQEFTTADADEDAGTLAVTEAMAEASATEAFNAKLTCTDSNATYNPDTDVCECNTGYTAHADTGACEPDEVEEETNWIPYATGGVVLLVVGFLAVQMIKS